MIVGCNIFWVKNLQMQLCGQVHYCATRTILKNRAQLDKPIEYASGGDPLLLIKFGIYCFSLCYEFFVHHALRVEKNLSTWS